jgi:hypothetical protein
LKPKKSRNSLKKVKKGVGMPDVVKLAPLPETVGVDEASLSEEEASRHDSESEISEHEEAEEETVEKPIFDEEGDLILSAADLSLPRKRVTEEQKRLKLEDLNRAEIAKWSSGIVQK